MPMKHEAFRFIILMEKYLPEIYQLVPRHPIELEFWHALTKNQEFIFGCLLRPRSLISANQCQQI
jgi:hypothetical protein